MPKVKFTDVGRCRLCWEADIPFVSNGSLDFVQVIREVKNKKAVASIEVDVSYDEDTQKGSILVGFNRVVGAFEVVEEGK